MNIKTFLLSAFLFAGLSASAHALLIEPATSNEINASNFTLPAGFSNSKNLDASDVDTLLGITGLTELYKSNVNGDTGLGLDEKSFADYYKTTFSRTATDPADALIEWVGSGTNFITCPECWLLVKDGSKPQYLFSLGSWNGQDSIELKGFYEVTDSGGTSGSISHVSIFGRAVQVTEPGTLALLGMGILGLTVARRRTQKQS